MDQTELLQALAKNEEFIAKAKATTTNEELAALLVEEGVSVTVEELNKAQEFVSSSDELSAEALESVSGGIWGYIVALVFVIGVANGINSTKKCK